MRRRDGKLERPSPPKSAEICNFFYLIMAHLTPFPHYIRSSPPPPPPISPRNKISSTVLTKEL